MDSKEAERNFIKMLSGAVDKDRREETVEVYLVSKENYKNLLFEKEMSPLKKPEEGKSIPPVYSNPKKDDVIYLLVGGAVFVPHQVIDEDEKDYIIRSDPNYGHKVKDYPIKGFVFALSKGVSEEEEAKKLRLKI